MTGVEQRSTTALWLVFLLFSAFAAACGGATASGRSAGPVEWQPLGDLNLATPYPLPEDAMYVRMRGGEQARALVQSMLSMAPEDDERWDYWARLFDGATEDGPTWMIVGPPPLIEILWVTTSANGEGRVARVSPEYGTMREMELYGLQALWEIEVSTREGRTTPSPTAALHMDETGAFLAMCVQAACVADQDHMLRNAGLFAGSTAAQVVETLEAEFARVSDEDYDLAIFGSSEVASRSLQMRSLVLGSSRFFLGASASDGEGIRARMVSELVTPRSCTPGTFPRLGQRWPLEPGNGNALSVMDINCIEVVDASQGNTAEAGTWAGDFGDIFPLLDGYLMTQWPVSDEADLVAEQLYTGFPLAEGVTLEQFSSAFVPDCNVDVAGNQPWLPRQFGELSYLFCPASQAYLLFVDNVAWVTVYPSPPTELTSANVLHLDDLGGAPATGQIVTTWLDPGSLSAINGTAPLMTRLSMQGSMMLLEAEIGSFPTLLLWLGRGAQLLQQ
jgi:hypothetical protein